MNWKGQARKEPYAQESKIVIRKNGKLKEIYNNNIASNSTWKQGKTATNKINYTTTPYDPITGANRP
jgi:hypothetical protein